jgi:hypothetical protein
MINTLFCVASSDTQATRIVSALRAAAFHEAEVSAWFQDLSRTRDYAVAQRIRLPEDAATPDAAARVRLLVRAGLPELYAHTYEHKLEDGHILITAELRDQAHTDAARQIVADAGATDVVEGALPPYRAGTTSRWTSGSESHYSSDRSAHGGGSTR